MSEKTPSADTRLYNVIDVRDGKVWGRNLGTTGAKELAKQLNARSDVLLFSVVPAASSADSESLKEQQS